MTVLCVYFAPITGYSRFTRNYCTHRPAAQIGEAVGFWQSFSHWIGGTCQADTLQEEHLWIQTQLFSLAESQSYSRVVGSRQVPLHEP